MKEIPTYRKTRSGSTTPDSTIFGRLLTSASGEEKRRAFVAWLQVNLELQLADLEEFLYSLPEEQRLYLETDLNSGGYRELVPQDAPALERLLFQTDLETVLELRHMC